MSTFFSVCTALLKISNRTEEYVSRKWAGVGKEREVRDHAYFNLLCPRDHTTVRQPV